MADKRQYKNGNYTATILSSSVGKAGKKESLCAEFFCQLKDHTDYAGVKSVVEGNSPVRVTIWLTDKALESSVTRDQLASLNLAEGMQSVAGNKLVGQEVLLYCKAEDPNEQGDIYDKFAISTGKGGGAQGTFVKTPAAKADISKLDALLGFRKATVEAPPVVLPDGVSF